MEENKTTLYQRYNYDNVFNRSVIAGLLYLLNHKLTYEQVWDDNTVENVTIPFAYNFAHAKDQRFAQDNYTFFGRECFSDKLIDGKFDMCPRFVMTYTGSQIESSNITNRFVKGTYMKDENGVLTSYTAFMYSIPLTLNFEFEGWIDTLETAFKIEQEIRDTFYKNQTFNVLYKGMKIGCRAGFPESYTVADKTVTKYLAYLEDAFLIDKAKRYDVKGKKYLSTPSKYYFTDLGLRNATLNFRQQEENHIMENVIYLELFKRGFAVDVGIVETSKRNESGKVVRNYAEVDFIASRGNNKFYIQSAFAMDTEEKQAQEKNSLLNIKDFFKKIIIVKDDIRRKRDEYGIITRSIYDFLLDEASLDY